MNEDEDALFHPPSFDTVLAALRMVDSFLSDLETSLKSQIPTAGPLLDALLEKVRLAEGAIEGVQHVAEIVAILQTGRTPVSPDDVDL